MATNAQSPFPIKDAVVVAVPAIAAMGTAYLLGYFTTVGLGYFTFLDFQDFLNSAAAFLPAFVVFYAFVLVAAYFSKHKEGSRIIESKLSDEEKEKRKKAWADPNDVLFDYEKGEWRDSRVFDLKAGTLASFLIFFVVFVALLLGIKVPVLLLWVSVLLLVFLGQWLLLYFDERYGDGLKYPYLIGAMIGLYVFSYGVTSSRMDSSNEQVRYRIVMNDGRLLEAAAMRRVGVTCPRIFGPRVA